MADQKDGTVSRNPEADKTKETSDASRGDRVSPPENANGRVDVPQIGGQSTAPK